MALVGLEGHFLRVNRMLCQLTGYAERDLVELSFQAITHPDDLESDLDHVRDVLAGRIERYSMEKRYFTARGHLIWINLSVSLVRDSSGAPIHFISQIEDISERKRLEAQLRRLADHDPLTSLWNRRRFEEELARQTSRSVRYGESAALLVLDLDNFKAINDRRGHKAGDRVLRAVASVLTGRVRVSDGAARIGGDEFALLLVNLPAAELDTFIAETGKAVEGIEIDAEADLGPIGISIGASWIDEATRDIDEAFAQADRSMYEAKRRRRSAPDPAGG